MTSSAAPGASPLLPLPVSDFCALLKEIIADGFPPVWLQGEITGLSHHRNGHFYFTLRDENSSLRSVIWASTYDKLRTVPKEGNQVIALGRLGLYPARGDLQFSISQILPAGTGGWQQQFEQTLKTLATDGLLAPEKKRPLPSMPLNIAVITSPSSAAWHDVLSVAHRRFPGINIVLIPATVQGPESTHSLLKAFARLNYLCEHPSSCPLGVLDAAILTRGGGSREDLWPFNDEQVARAVAACPVPLVAAIGHETDLTICELVADLRAPTPSAAAERLVPEIHLWLDRLNASERALAVQLVSRFHEAQENISAQEEALRRALQIYLEKQEQTLDNLAARLEALSPLNILSRGYLLATTLDGEPISSSQQLQPGNVIQLKWHDGSHQAQITITPS